MDHSTQAYGAVAGELILNSCVSAMVSVAAVVFAMTTRDLGGPVLVLAHVVLWSSAAYVVLVVAAIVSGARLIEALVGRLAAMPIVGRRIAANPERVRQVEDAIRHAFLERRALLAQVLPLEVLAQTILVFEIYWTLRSMSVAVSGGTALILEALTKAANVIQFVGVTEAGYAVLFGWLGMSAAAGLTLSLVKLLRSLTASAIGLSVLRQFDRAALTTPAAQASGPS
jgi:hypothetical protein